MIRLEMLLVGAPFNILNKSSRFIYDFEKYNKIREKSLLSANEIIKIKKINKDKVLGSVIELIREKQFIGRIRGKREAKEYLMKLDIKSNLT